MLTMHAANPAVRIQFLAKIMVLQIPPRLILEPEPGVIPEHSLDAPFTHTPQKEFKLNNKNPQIFIMYFLSYIFFGTKSLLK